MRKSSYESWQIEEEFGLLHEEEEHFATGCLVREAFRLRVPLPPHGPLDDDPGPFWEVGPRLGAHYLTPRGYNVLREAVRKERKARWEDRSHWVPWVSALTGILGLVVGLAVNLNK